MIKSFPKIFALGTDYIKDILDGEVEVTEKIDGSQFGFGRIDGELFVRSKGAMLHFSAPNNMFKEGVEYIDSIKDLIPDNMVFHAEYLQTPSHNSLTYSKIPKNHLCLFSVSDNTDKFYTHDEIKKWAEVLGIDAVPLIYKGTIESTDFILEMIGSESYLGGANAEGVVVKNYNKPFLLGGQPIPVMSGKYVSEAFKEVHRASWTGKHTSGGAWDNYKAGFKTEARWEKAIQYLRDSGELTESPKDIGKLIARVMVDIEEEEKEEIKKFLWNHFGKEVLRTGVQGLPEFYKLKLLRKLDENKEEKETNQEEG
jgi:hypothetical protein